MTNWQTFSRSILIVVLAFTVGFSLAADSFTIRCDWFDRGNVDAGAAGRG